MKKLITTAALSFVMISATIAQTNWKVDGSHSKLGFAVTHMMVSEVEGKFKIYEGAVASKSETDFTDSKIEFSVDVNSINTDDEKRDGHLKSADFFDAEKFPKMTFKATSMKAGKIKGTYDLEGDLTMHGVTKPAEFEVTYGGTINTGKVEKAGFKLVGKINRHDYGLTWSNKVPTGELVVGDNVDIIGKIEVDKKA